MLIYFDDLLQNSLIFVTNINVLVKEINKQQNSKIM